MTLNQSKVIATAKANIARWRADPVAFVREQFGVEPDAWQVDFLLAFTHKQRIAAKACKGPGKTAVLAWCAWLFIATRPYAKVVATSITGDNLRDGLWAEMAKWQQRSEFLKQAFTWRAERITANDHEETWFMSARRWSKDATGEQQANALAGLHADYILFIIDEAGGVPDAVMAAAEASLASGIECKLLICGNPTHLSGPLYRACTVESSLWHVIEITGDPDDPKRSPRISIQWAREQIQKYGADNPWVLVNVFGRFPPSSLNSLLGPDEIREAMRRELREDAYTFAPKILGIDVARQGDDCSVIAPRQGLVCFRPKVLRIPNTQELAGVVAASIKKFQPDAVFIDATGGWGWGVIDPLQKWGYAVTPVNFGGKADDAQFFNKRSEMSFRLAMHIKHGGCLPDLPELVEEGCAMTYTHERDKMRLIEKELVKEAIGRSPDIWDGFMLTFAHEVAGKDPYAEHRMNKGTEDYDPVRHNYRERENLRDSNLADYNPLG